LEEPLEDMLGCFDLIEIEIWIENGGFGVVSCKARSFVVPQSVLTQDGKGWRERTRLGEVKAGRYFSLDRDCRLWGWRESFCWKRAANEGKMSLTRRMGGMCIESLRLREAE